MILAPRRECQWQRGRPQRIRAHASRAVSLLKQGVGLGSSQGKNYWHASNACSDLRVVSRGGQGDS